MSPAFRVALAGSAAFHVALLVAVPISPPAYDVEQAPASVELTLTHAPRPQPPVETLHAPSPEPVTPPEPSSVQSSEHRGAVAETQPGYVKNPPPVYPESSRTRGEEGTVVLEVEVLASGRCGQVTVLHSSGHHKLDEAAISAIRHWVFRPARRWQQPVAFWVEIPVTFTLSDHE